MYATAPTNATSSPARAMRGRADDVGRSDCGVAIETLPAGERSPCRARLNCASAFRFPFSVVRLGFLPLSAFRFPPSACLSKVRGVRAKQQRVAAPRRSGRAARMLVLVAGLLALARGAAAGGPAPFVRSEAREPCASYAPLRNPYFGDLHVHTALSLDASTQGTRVQPADAYRFARGETLGIQPYAADGSALRHLRLARPLDFAAVTDHAELFGELTICQTPGLPGYDALPCVIYRRWPRLAFFIANSQVANSNAPRRFSFCGADGGLSRAQAHTPWQVVRDAAEGAYDRTAACGFTTFIGYEWTGAPGSNNIHRNVLFRSEAVPDLPVTYVEAPRPEELWSQLTTACRALPGCAFLTIPHNSNLSNGLMFQTVTAAGKPISAA